MRPEPNLPQCTTNSSDCTVKTAVISDSHALLSECLPYLNCSIYGRTNKDDIFTLVCPSSFNQHALQLGCCLGKNGSVRYFRVVTMSRRFFARIASFIHHVPSAKHMIRISRAPVNTSCSSYRRSYLWLPPHGSVCMTTCRRIGEVILLLVNDTFQKSSDAVDS